MTSSSLSRRVFLQQATAATFTLGQPKAVLAAGQVVSKSPLAKYALKSVGKHVLPFFSFGAYFGNSGYPVDIEILDRNAKGWCLLDDLMDLPIILNDDFVVPEYVHEGEIFRMGHLLAEENLGIRERFSYDEANSGLHCLREDLLAFIENSSFNCLEEVAEIPVKDFYEHVYRPQFKKSLDMLMDGFDKIPEKGFELYGGYLEDVQKPDFERLKKAYPQCAQKLDDIMERYNQLKLLKKYSPIGQTRIEKIGFGQYKLTSPQIL